MLTNKGWFKKGNKVNLKPPLFKNCLNCNKQFLVDRSNPKTKYCCHQCSVRDLITGKPKSEETKRRMRDNSARYWANHKMSQEHIKKATKGWKPYQSGEKHWNWKGGITPLLNKLRFTKKYKEWTKAVYERDDYTCQICKQKGGRLNADHIINYAKLVYDKNWKLLWNIDNGRTLCVECHRKTDTYAKKFAKKYT